MNENDQMIQFEIMISNTKGMHARASAKFVEVVESFDAECEISKDGISVSGDSIMGLLMLAASKGSFVHIKVRGKESVAMATAIKKLINNIFFENF